MRAVLSSILRLSADAILLTLALVMLRVPARRNRLSAAVTAVVLRRATYAILVRKLPRAADAVATLGFAAVLFHTHRLPLPRALALAALFGAVRREGPR